MNMIWFIVVFLTVESVLRPIYYIKYFRVVGPILKELHDGGYIGAYCGMVISITLCWTAMIFAWMIALNG
jgi:hypothetical protein